MNPYVAWLEAEKVAEGSPGHLKGPHGQKLMAMAAANRKAKAQGLPEPYGSDAFRRNFRSWKYYKRKGKKPPKRYYTPSPSKQ